MLSLLGAQSNDVGPRATVAYRLGDARCDFELPYIAKSSAYKMTSIDFFGHFI